MIYRQLFIVLIFGLVITSCSTTAQQQAFFLDTKVNWVRSTLRSEYLGPKLINSMQPLLTDGKIYQGNVADGIVALDEKTGKFLWRKQIKNGVGTGAAHHKGILYFSGNDGQFYAVKASNGQIVWTFPIQAESLSAPVIDGASVYFLAGSGTLYSLDLSNGKMNWSYTQRDNANINVRAASSPVIDGSFLYVGFSDGTFASFDKSKGFLKWERNLATPQDRFKDIGATPVISGDNIFVSTYSGILFSIKKSNGDINWKSEEGSSSAVTIDKNRIYYATSSRKVLALDKQTGKEIWSHTVKHGVGSKPAILKDMVIFGTSEGAVEVLSAIDGKFITQYSTGWGVSAPIAVNEVLENIYVMSNYGNIYSINLKWKRPSSQWPWERKSL